MIFVPFIIIGGWMAGSLLNVSCTQHHVVEVLMCDYRNYCTAKLEDGTVWQYDLPRVGEEKEICR